MLDADCSEHLCALLSPRLVFAWCGTCRSAAAALRGVTDDRFALAGATDEHVPDTAAWPSLPPALGAWLLCRQRTLVEEHACAFLCGRDGTWLPDRRRRDLATTYLVGAAFGDRTQAAADALWARCDRACAVRATVAVLEAPNGVASYLRTLTRPRMDAVFREHFLSPPVLSPDVSRLLLDWHGQMCDSAAPPARRVPKNPHPAQAFDAAGVV